MNPTKRHSPNQIEALFSRSRSPIPPAIALSKPIDRLATTIHPKTDPHQRHSQRHPLKKTPAQPNRFDAISKPDVRKT
jgi:hypothetical protein